MKKSKNKVSPETVSRRLQQALARFPDPSEQWRRRTDTKRHLIEALREPLREAIRQRGCSLSDLVALLRESGLTVHLSTLKRYLGPVGDDRAVYRRARSKNPPPGRPTAGSVEVPEPLGTPEAPDAPKRPDVADALEPARAEAPMPSSGPPARSNPHLSSRFVPKPELPYDELLRRSEAQKP